MSFELPAKPASYSRRAAVGLLLAGLTGSAAHFAVPGRQHATFVPKKKRPAGPPLKEWPTLDVLAQKMVDRKLVPGASVSVAHDGVLLYSKGFGMANLETQTPLTSQTGLRIASITKQFTAASILKLAEQGKLSVDDHLSRFLPDFPKAENITLSQLMSHTSGMGDYINGQDMGILTEAQRRDYNSDEVIHVIKASHPLYRTQPGAAWLYSNSGFALLGIVVEKVSGKSFADFAQAELFTPAGLDDTLIEKTCNSTATCGSYRANYRAPHGFDPILPVSASFIGGAGAIRSTTDDLCRWHAALLNGKILNEVSLKAMTTPAYLRNGTPAMERRGDEPLEYGYGLGLGNDDSRPFIAHGGRINGYTGHLRSYTDEKLSVAILYNCDGSGVSGFPGAHKAVRNEAVRLGMAELIA